jgi:transposase
MYYIGLDVHKRKISYCVKDSSGKIHSEGSIPAARIDLDLWMKTLPQPWNAAMEATMFTGWIHDHLKPHAAALKVAHPLMLRAIAAAKKKNDRIDANKICDCLRCDFLPECYMASTAIRERRRTLRYRNLLVRQMVQMKIKISSLLMEAGVSYNKQRLHKAGYFRELLATNPNIDEGLRSLLRQCREAVVRLGKTESALLRSLEHDRLLVDRVERLRSIPAIGPITALTWALEIGEVQRFS